jgi:hypothetical protein
MLSIFQVFPCMMQIALFWPKLLPALFLKPRYPCPFEILEEALPATTVSLPEAIESDQITSPFDM